MSDQVQDWRDSFPIITHFPQFAHHTHCIENMLLYDRQISLLEEQHDESEKARVSY
jgi:hypothetical protein